MNDNSGTYYCVWWTGELRPETNLIAIFRNKSEAGKFLEQARKDIPLDGDEELYITTEITNEKGETT